MARTKISGLDKLNAKLFKLPTLAEQEIRKTMESIAEEIATLARSLVPVGRVDGGALKASIGWAWSDKAPKSKFILGRVNGGPNDLRIVVFAGDDEAFYARWVEFGTKPHTITARDGKTLVGDDGTRYGKSVNHPGVVETQPYFIPAYNAYKKRAARRIGNAVGRSIRKVAASGG